MTIIYKILCQVRKKFTIVKATTLEDLEIVTKMKWSDNELLEKDSRPNRDNGRPSYQHNL